MSETLLKNVQGMLNEEKLTRATLSNYSTGQFKELDKVLKEAREERVEEELKKLCDEHLSHTKTSITALYLSGMIALSRQIIDDAALVNLIGIFNDNHKGLIVRYLCERMLDLGESKFALRTLAECCKSENEEEALYSVWERLIKVDYEEADLTKALAERYEREGNMELTIEYLKKALHRYIAKQLWTNTREIWIKLLTYCPEDIEFFLSVQKRIGEKISKDKASMLLLDLYQSCRKRDDIDTAIGVLKIILNYDERDVHARREITDCYREKYKGHSQLEEYIHISNLTQNYRNVHEAIGDFEKHIAFDRGSFVFHRTWGVGRISGVEGKEVTIDFARKRGHSMSLEMAVSALQTLAKDHIWVLKATWKKEKLHDKVKDDPVWALKTVIKSFDNSCDLKHIKAELCPSILSPGEWPTWNNKAREILKQDATFGVSPDNVDLWTVRERPLSREEKLYFEFKAQRDFFDRIKILKDFVNIGNAEGAGGGKAPGGESQESAQESEYFGEMLAYFLSYLKPNTQVNEQSLASFLLVKDLVARYPLLGSNLKVTFTELYSSIDDVGGLYENLKDTRLKEAFLQHIQLFVPDWENIYLSLFPREPHNTIIQSIESQKSVGKLTDLARNCFEHYRDCKEAVYYLYKNHSGDPWYKSMGLSQEKQLIVLVHVLDLSYREIENRRDLVKNRKINKLVYHLLFRDGALNRFIEGADQDGALRLWTFINDVKDLDPADKMDLRTKISRKYPDIKFLGDVEKRASLGLIVTLRMFEEKQKQLARLQNEEIPANSKEIEFALSLGDLRENAEYKAAKEKQTLLNATVARLQEDIDRAQVFDPATVNTARAGFGTRVVLLNESTGTKEEYSILGPWESDPENRIISYLSPFGSAILGKSPGEGFDFTVDNEKRSYRVESISAAL